MLVLAATSIVHHGSAHSADSHEVPAATYTNGVVKKLDLDLGKLTIKHDAIKHLDMPGMTMVFSVKDKGLLTGIKAGDAVRFMVQQEGGKMIVTDIQPAR